jgi:phage-related tail fiber protein
MTVKYFALLTNLGAAKLANAAALGIQLQITQMAVGDGGGTLPTPSPAQTQLIGEKRRAALNSLSIDEASSSQIIAEQVIPETDGGWWIREIGLFDKDGILIAIANCPDTYKPQLQEGSGRTQTVRMVLIVSSTEAVTLKIDPSVVLATRKYVDDKVIEVKAHTDDLLAEHVKSRNHPDASKTERGFVKLSSATDSTSETLAATPKAVKAALDASLPIDGTAASATKLATARKIGGVDFDGTKDIALPFISTTDTNILLPGNLGVRNLEVRAWPGSAEGGQIDLFDKDGVRVAFIDIDSSGNTRVVSVPGGVALVINKTTGDVSTPKAFSATGDITSVGSVRAGNGAAELAANGDITGPVWGSTLYTYLTDLLIGIPMPYPLSSAPAGFLKCNGATFSTSAYPRLALKYPSGVLPDMRANAIRGWDDGRGVDAGRALLSQQLDALQNITGNFYMGGSKQVAGVVTTGAFGPMEVNNALGQQATGAGNIGGITFDASRVARAAAETRMRNIAFNYIVRAI